MDTLNSNEEAARYVREKRETEVAAQFGLPPGSVEFVIHDIKGLSDNNVARVEDEGLLVVPDKRGHVIYQRKDDIEV